MDNLNYYLAITTGPIYKTLQKAVTTRELWVASYFLSKLMEIIITHPNLKESLLSPSPLPEDIDRNGAGVYPDRAYWLLKSPLTNDQFESINDNILKELSEAASSLITPIELKNYLKLYWVQVSWTEIELEEKSYLFRLNEILDGIELQEKWEQSNPISLIEFLIAKDKETGLKRPVYKWRNESNQKGLFPYVLESGIERFPSIIEICTREFLEMDNNNWYRENVLEAISSKLSNNDDSKEDEQLMDSIKREFNKDETDHFLSRHKYVCIIQSDGDGVGSYLKNNVGNDVQKLKDFSMELSMFSTEATSKVVNYGGIPVYAGGDDLLFFAPVKDKDGKDTVIHLIESLDKDFKAKFKSAAVSQSFGLSITYYKYPLAEARETASNLMFFGAKKQPCKNYIDGTLQKHSGQQINFGFNLASEYFASFKTLMDDAISEKENFLNSVMFKLDDQLSILEKISTDEAKLILFFDNNFNESSHQKYKDFFKKLAKYIKETFDFYIHEDIDQKISRIYGSLRFIQFLNAKDKDNE
jgi:CRISPR-associated protein Cmr2